MLFLQFALLTLGGTVYSKPTQSTQSTTSEAQSLHCTVQYAILNIPLY